MHNQQQQRRNLYEQKIAYEKTLKWPNNVNYLEATLFKDDRNAAEIYIWITTAEMARIRLINTIRFTTK